MRKRYNIRWTQSDEAELKRLVRNFNAKVDRLSKKEDYKKNVLPDKVKVAQLKEMIGTRQDLKRELNALSRFTKRGSEKLVDIPENNNNLKITKWQLTETNRRLSFVNAKRENKLRELSSTELKSRGESLGYTLGDIGMGDVDSVALKPIKAFTPSMGKAEIKRRYNTIIKESQDLYWHKKDIILKNNFINAISENYRKSDIEDVIKAIESMDFKEFYRIYKEEGASFEFNYPPTDEEYQGYLSVLKATWVDRQSVE